ncbi:MAG: hypothetical protein M3680_30555 [Myxococcota bacterium]|nr:hypothetical protein [Myxococcota bacterium]
MPIRIIGLRIVRTGQPAGEEVELAQSGGEVELELLGIDALGLRDDE